MRRTLGTRHPVIGPVIVMAALALAACGGKTEVAQGEEAEQPSVTLGGSDVATAVRGTLRAGVAISGPLEAKVNVTLGAPLAEQLVEMFVNEGDAVRQGQPLARFRDDVLRSSAASAQAELVTARAAASLAVAESTRSETLFAEGAIARRDRDNALLALEQARARFALAEANAAHASERLADATLRAPVSGVISERHAQAGDRVDFGKPVVTLVNNSVLQLEASVEARQLASLRVGQRVTLVVTDAAADTVSGRIARINPVADAATRQVKIYVEVPNPRGRLVGGLYVSGVALTADVPDAVSVPRSAVRVEGDQRDNVIYLVSSGRIARRVVQLGVEDAANGRVAVTSGVAAGDTVVIGPVDDLADGTRVQIATAAADSSKAR